VASQNLPAAAVWHAARCAALPGVQPHQVSARHGGLGTAAEHGGLHPPVLSAHASLLPAATEWHVPRRLQIRVRPKPPMHHNPSPLTLVVQVLRAYDSPYSCSERRASFGMHRAEARRAPPARGPARGCGPACPASATARRASRRSARSRGPITLCRFRGAPTFAGGCCAQRHGAAAPGARPRARQGAGARAGARLALHERGERQVVKQVCEVLPDVRVAVLPQALVVEAVPAARQGGWASGRGRHDAPRAGKSGAAGALTLA